MTLRDAWELESGRWAAWARTPGHDAIAEQANIPAFREMLPPPGRRTLDLRCGEGRLGRRPTPLGHRIAGVDGSETLAGLARDGGGYDEVRVADAAKLPFGERAFDLVVAFMSGQDLGDLEAALGEAARVLAPGGALALAVAHPLASWRLAEGASYFERFRYAETMRRGGQEVTFHSVHLPLGDPVGAVLDAGLALEALRERVELADAPPVPDVVALARRPLFLHLLARAPC